MSVHTDLKAQIKANISAITGINKVFGYEKGELEYPAAIVVLDGIESMADSTNSNDRKYTYRVSVYQEMVDDGVGAEEAEDRIDNLVDSIISKFENDWDLAGLAYNTAIKGITAYQDRGNQCRVVQFTIEAFCNITLT